MYDDRWARSEQTMQQLPEPVFLEAIRVASAAAVLFGLLLAGPLIG